MRRSTDLKAAMLMAPRSCARPSALREVSLPGGASQKLGEAIAECCQRVSSEDMMNWNHAKLSSYSAFSLFLGLTLFFTVFVPANAVRGADLCKAVALRDVAALEDPSSILKKGSLIYAVSGYVIDRKTGSTAFCSHGGYCYPTHVTANGKNAEAVKLLNCKVGKPLEPDDEDRIWYSVDVDRSKNPASDLRWNDLDDKFLNMGLCSACAANAVEYYVQKPSSRCARLARRALEGDPDALKELVSFPDYCWWNY